MLPDVVDDFRLANPYCKGHEAIFYSFYVFFTKFAAGISLGVSTLCLEWVSITLTHVWLIVYGEMHNTSCERYQDAALDFVLICLLNGISASLCVCRFAGYDTGACKQPAPVVYTLKLLIGAAPVAFIVTGLMILLLYPITEDVRRSNKLHLEELRCVEIINGYMREKL